MTHPCLFDDDYTQPHKLFESENSEIFSAVGEHRKTDKEYDNEKDRKIFETTLKGIVNTIRKPGKTIAFDRDDLINLIKCLTGADLVKFDLIPEFNRCCVSDKGLIQISHIQVVVKDQPLGFLDAFPRQAEFIRSQGISLRAIRARKRPTN
jgi:hypothetical protein